MFQNSVGFLTLSFVFMLLLGLVIPETHAQAYKPNNNQPTYGITHSEIKGTIEILARMIKSLDHKLYLHESREKQFSDTSSKTLNALTSDHTQAHKSSQTINRQLTKLEERIMSVEALIKTNDERQRRLINQINDGINRLLIKDMSNTPPLPPLPNFPISKPPTSDASVKTAADVKKILKKVFNVDQNLEKGLRDMSNEIKIVGETTQKFMDLLNKRHDRLSDAIGTCKSDANIGDTSEKLKDISISLAKHVTTASDLLQQIGSGGNCGDLDNEVIISELGKLDRLYQDQEKEIKNLSVDSKKAFKTQEMTLKKLLNESRAEDGVIDKSFSEVLADLTKITGDSQKRLEKLNQDVKSAIKESTELLKGDVSVMARNIKDGNGNIMDAIDDTGSQVDNLQKSVTENHDDMQHGIKSIGKVEQVMINTADAVLETKRSIEFGIQQIILELSEIVKTSGRTINSTLSDQIKTVSFDIINNQTTALTNMTSKVEKEISQVWRQIGVMYQQMSTTVELLDDLQNTTKAHMEASLGQVGNVDGTVDKINTKVSGVEDNVNYLLGRLSLVVSEFNNMKAGVGNELEKLKDLAADNKIDVLHDGSVQPIPIKINHRRHTKHIPPAPPPLPRYPPSFRYPPTSQKNKNKHNDPYYGQVLPRLPKMPNDFNHSPQARHG